MACQSNRAGFGLTMCGTIRSSQVGFGYLNDYQLISLDFNTGPYGTIWDCKQPYWTIRDHTGQYGIIWDHTGPNGTIRDHMEPYGTVSNHIGP